MSDEIIMIMINMSVCRAIDKFYEKYGEDEKLRPDEVCVYFIDSFYHEHTDRLWYASHRFSVHMVRGCVASNSKIPSKYWGIPHIWCMVKIDGDRKYYVDPCSVIFKGEIPHVPRYYISMTPPWWLKSYSSVTRNIRRFKRWIAKSPFNGICDKVHLIHAKWSDLIYKFYSKN